MGAPKIDQDELSAYVESALKGISSVNSCGYTLKPTGVKFHIGMTNEVKYDGGVKVIVAHVGAEQTKMTDSFIEFEIITR